LPPGFLPVALVLNLKTTRTYQIRLIFQDFYAQPSREAAETFLKKWYFWATHSRMSPSSKPPETARNPFFLHLRKA
jgi:hypothetical protein